MTTLTADEVSKEAARINQSEIDRQQIRATTYSYPNMDMDDAYAIQKAGIDLKITSGRKIIGYKIGLTSRAMQMAMNIDEPDYGVLLDDMAYENDSEIEVSRFLDPRVEVELAFVLKDQLYGEEVTVDQVMDATDYVIPALELIAARSHRVDPETKKPRTVLDTISDNAANAGIITGGRAVKPGEIDLRWVPALMYRNDILEETGVAAGVLDNPAAGICWVAKRFARHGVALEPGQIILAGSFTRPVTAEAGDDFHVDYGPLGCIDCKFV